MKRTLTQYKKDGKFMPLVYVNEPMWNTLDGQQYLRDFYTLQEAYYAELLTVDEFVFYSDRLVYKDKPCSPDDQYLELLVPAV